MQEKQKILVIGSLAYDHVMQYEALFKDAMVPGNYNISVVPTKREVFFGGCSGNIAYSLRLLDETPVLMTAAGNDFEKYRARLVEQGCDVSGVFVSEKHLTASAFIVTDRDANQITIFEPGAMFAAEEHLSVRGITNIAMAIISPDKPERMTRLALECAEVGIPYIFDPGQEVNMFESGDLLKAIRGAKILIMNDYESALILKKIGMEREKLLALVPTVIETHGANGCSITTVDGVVKVKAVPPMKLVDPTGAGDAFRAGVLAGQIRGFGLEKSGQMGALLATYSLEHAGTQMHTFTWDEFAQRFQKSFGKML